MDLKFSSHTVTSYKKDLDSFVSFLVKHFEVSSKKKIPYKDIDSLTIRLFLGELSDQNYKVSSIARKLASIKSFYKYLSKKKVIGSDPASNVITPKYEKRMPSFFTNKEVNKLFSANSAPISLRPKKEKVLEFEMVRDRAILEILYSSGLRLAELVSLNDSNINFEQCLLDVMGKGKKQRIVPFGSKAKDALEKYISIRNLFSGSFKPKPDRALFITAKGNRVYPVLVQRVVKKYLLLATEQSKKSPHIFRHTFATHLLDNGAGLREISEMLGHSNLVTTEIYTSVSFDRIKKVYKNAHPRAEKAQNKNDNP